MKSLRTALAAIALAIPSAALADVKLPAVFSDNMVLQRGEKIPIFGTADKGEKITIKAGAATADTVADDSGKFRALLNTTDLKDTFDVSIWGNNAITIKNAIVGEVWVASGQSNMEMSVNSSKDVDMEIASANWPEIRMFTVKKAISDKPLADVTGTWQICTPQTVGGFSAVGYFFARDVHQVLKVPVGVIHTSWGGTVAEAWTSREALEAADSDVKTIITRFDEAQAKLTPEVKAKFDDDTKAWVAAGRPRDKQPRRPAGFRDHNSPSSLYNAMIAPIVGYGIKGAIWYQGESNAGRSYQYRKLFPAMITDWRTRWGQGDFSFYYVQLANFMARDKEPADSGWAELREAQTLTLALPNTGMATIIDIGEANDIHPRDKQDVGRRLARWALAKDYGKTLVYSGPMYDSMSVEGDTVRVKFKNGEGLRFNGEKAMSFAIAGEDKKFVWADAKVDKDTVVLKAPGVTKPVAARYGWGNNPDANVYNKTGLPLVPFRTDDWAGVTMGKN